MSLDLIEKSSVYSAFNFQPEYAVYSTSIFNFLNGGLATINRNSVTLCYNILQYVETFKNLYKGKLEDAVTLMDIHHNLERGISEEAISAPINFLELLSIKTREKMFYSSGLALTKKVYSTLLYATVTVFLAKQLYLLYGYYLIITPEHATKLHEMLSGLITYTDVSNYLKNNCVYTEEAAIEFFRESLI